MADRISLTGLSARGHHGVFDFERRDGQMFTCDVTIWADLTAAAASDDVDDTIDYGTVAGIVHDHLTGRPRDLIEAVAGGIVDEILTMSPLIHAVEATVHKPSAPIPHKFSDVSVTIRRSVKAIGAGR